MLWENQMSLEVLFIFLFSFFLFFIYKYEKRHGKEVAKGTFTWKGFVSLKVKKESRKNLVSYQKTSNN